MCVRGTKTGKVGKNLSVVITTENCPRIIYVQGTIFYVTGPLLQLIRQIH